MGQRAVVVGVLIVRGVFRGDDDVAASLRLEWTVFRASPPSQLLLRWLLGGVQRHDGRVAVMWVILVRQQNPVSDKDRFPVGCGGWCGNFDLHGHARLARRRFQLWRQERDQAQNGFEADPFQSVQSRQQVPSFRVIFRSQVLEQTETSIPESDGGVEVRDGVSAPDDPAGKSQGQLFRRRQSGVGLEFQESVEAAEAFVVQLLDHFRPHRRDGLPLLRVGQLGLELAEKQLAAFDLPPTLFVLVNQLSHVPEHIAAQIH